MMMSSELSYSDLIGADYEADQLLLAKARKNLLAFTKYTKPDFKINWHHRLTAKYLMKWIRGEIRYLIVSQPPRHGKSELASRRLAPFIFGVDPNAQIIGTAYGSTLASKNNRDVQRIIDSEVYARVFPHVKLSGKQVRAVGQNRPLRNSDEFEIVDHKGYYRSAGIGGGITGMGAQYFIIDDPIKSPKEANSEVYREAVWEWWNSAALTRLEQDSRALLIMTRWHEDDLAGRLLAQTKSGDPNALPWVDLNLPAIRDDLENPEDPRELGEPLWPGKYDLGRLKNIETSIGPRWWNALYQQRPTALEGGLIKKEWIERNFYTELPTRWDRQVISMDATFKKSESSDWVVIQVWGTSGRYKFLLDQVRARLSFVESVREMLALTQKWPAAHKKIIEQAANGEAIINMLQTEGISGVVGYKPRESKEARLSACAVAFQAGDVRYPHPQIAPWVQVNVDEIVKFPNAKHDDTVDATTQALIDLLDDAGWLEDIIQM